MKAEKINWVKDIDWNKKLVVFFGDEVKKYIHHIKICRKGEIELFPEHNCDHPWEHVEFIEHKNVLLSRVDDRKFVVVTNSSYIIDHLTNLMKGARVIANPNFTRSGNVESYIDKKDVVVYVCTNGKIKNAMPKNGEIIKWDNLSEVAEWLANIYFDMGD